MISVSVPGLLETEISGRSPWRGRSASELGLVLFSGRIPDSHLFRLEGGKIRYIHTITMCDAFNCSFDLPEYLVAERSARGGQLE